MHSRGICVIKMEVRFTDVNGRDLFLEKEILKANRYLIRLRGLLMSKNRWGIDGLNMPTQRRLSRRIGWCLDRVVAVLRRERELRS